MSDPFDIAQDFDLITWNRFGGDYGHRIPQMVIVLSKNERLMWLDVVDLSADQNPRCHTSITAEALRMWHVQPGVHLTICRNGEEVFRGY